MMQVGFYKAIEGKNPTESFSFYPGVIVAKFNS